MRVGKEASCRFTTLMYAQVLRGSITYIFENAVAQPTFVQMYADLCARLSQALPDFPPGEGESKPQTFRRILLNTCQEEYEGAALARDNLGAFDDPEERLCFDCGFCICSDCTRHLRQQFTLNIMNSTRLLQLCCCRMIEEKKVKQRMLGNVRLISHLHKIKVVNEKIIHLCVRELLGDDAKVIPPEVRELW